MATALANGFPPKVLKQQKQKQGEVLPDNANQKKQSKIIIMQGRGEKKTLLRQAN